MTPWDVLVELNRRGIRLSAGRMASHTPRRVIV
jgi:hypothetical protein